MLIRNSHQAEAVWDRTVRRPVTIYKAAIAQPFGSYGFPIKYGGQSLYRPAPYLYISQTHVPEGTLAIGSQHSNSKKGDNSLPPDWFGAMPNPLGITNRSDCYPPPWFVPGMGGRGAQCSSRIGYPPIIPALRRCPTYATDA